MAPIYLGKQKGFFSARGIGLELVAAQGGAAIVPGVVSGQFQFGFSNITSPMIAASKGVPVKITSAGNSSTGKEGADFGAIVVNADSPIQTAKDLEGKTVSVNSLKNIGDTTVRASVRKAGGDPDKVAAYFTTSTLSTPTASWRPSPTWRHFCHDPLAPRAMALFEIVPRLGLVPAGYLPPLHQVVAALVDEAGRPLFWFSLYETLHGWAIGLGIVIGVVPFLRAATHSTIEFLRPIPSVALIPLAVLLFGADLRSKLLLIVYASFWQILIQVLYGVQDVDPVARDTARSYRFSRWGHIRYVIWPTGLPYVMTGLRLASAVALVLAITGELIIGAPGIGRHQHLDPMGGTPRAVLASFRSREAGA